MTTVTSPWPGLGQPLFEMCWVYMAIAQIVEKSVPNHPGKPLHPRANVGKKCSKPSWPAFTPPLSSYAHMETAHFKKGFPKSMTPKTQRHSGQIVHTLHKLQTHIGLQPPTPNPQHVPAS